jgi:disease resistance protein RPS2
MPYGVHAKLTLNLEFIVFSFLFSTEPLIKMMPPNDEVRDYFWRYVERVAEGKRKCTFCGKLFAEGTSITRIKWHLSRVEGHGVTTCKLVTPEVQDAAREAVDGLSNNEVANAISDSSQEQNNVISNQADEPRGDSSQPIDAIMNYAQNIVGVRTEPAVQLLVQSNAEADNLARDDGRVQVRVQDMEQGVEEEIISSHLEAANGIENTGEGSIQHVDRNAQENTGEATQDLVHHIDGRSWSEIQAISSYLFQNTSETRGDLLPTSSTMPVGQEFKVIKESICSSLMDDEFSVIGIYGMAGVGKTELLKHVHNELLQRSDIPHCLYWVTVNHDSSINRLQKLIAAHIGLDLSSEDDDVCTAAKLSKKLIQKKTWILILDNLCDIFEPETVGIPVSLQGCKLIVSSQSKEVCEGMTSRNIRVNPLSNGEAWDLLKQQRRQGIPFSPPDAEQIARDTTNECDGLPLGVISLARSTRGFRYKRQWRNTLQNLRHSRDGLDHMEKALQTLRESYTHLLRFDRQQCFLYCALFPGGFKIPKEDLIAYLIDEGVIEKRESREDEFDEGHSLLDRLEDFCLLESVDGGCAVKMPSLLRIMAIRILQKDYQAMVRAGVQLEEVMDAKDWKENLARVSLIENQIKEIPSGHSPRCPRLSTLLLHYNIELRLIGDAFFEQLHELKILDLSYTDILIMPDAVSNLVRLTALLLIGCNKLRHVPSLEKLREMRRLDLYRTALENIPQGLECLSELRYLRMNNCGEKEFPSGILPNLSRLQVFILGWGQYAPMTVKGEEVGCLKKLEALECHLKGHSDFVKFFKSQDKTQSLKTYKIFVGQFEENDGYNVKTCCRKSAGGFGNLSVNKDGDFQITFPNDNQELIVRECSSMESLVSSSWFCSSPLPQPSPSYNGIFSGLKEFYCFGCTSMKKLFPLVFLENLEVIEVSNCEKMEEIIETRSNDEGLKGEESSGSRILKLELLKLKILKLIELPKLKSICNAKLICHSLKVIHIRNCQELKRMPICLPLYESDQPSTRLSLHEIIAYPKEWWDSVLEWEHPYAKNVLGLFVKFQ